MADDQGFDLGALLQQAQEMQQRLLEAQSRAAETVVEGQAGGGMVRIRVNGGFEFEAVEIAPEVIDPGDPEMLQDLVLAALHDAARRLGEVQAAAVGPLDPTNLGGGGIDLEGLGLGGLLGGGAPEVEAQDDTAEPGV